MSCSSATAARPRGCAGPSPGFEDRLNGIAEERPLDEEDAGVDRLIRWSLVALIAFTPLAFGTVEVWSIAIMEWGIVTLLLLLALGRFLAHRPSPSARKGPTGLELPVALFLVFCA